jgi:hypothetical protein
MHPDASLQLSLAEYGSGGSIDGLRMEETLTRSDPTAPTQHTGGIKPAPVSTTVIVDNFDDNKLMGWGCCSSWPDASPKARSTGAVRVPSCSSVDAGSALRSQRPRTVRRRPLGNFCPSSPAQSAPGARPARWLRQAGLSRRADVPRSAEPEFHERWPFA